LGSPDGRPLRGRNNERMGAVELIGNEAGPGETRGLPAAVGARPAAGGRELMTGFLVAAAVFVGVGCGGGHAAHAPSNGASQPAQMLTSRQACQELRADLARNGGAPDIPALRKIADHVTAARLAADARTAVRDIGHTGVAPLALALLEDDCDRAGVKITPPQALADNGPGDRP
jgi:hypothetical protein